MGEVDGVGDVGGAKCVAGVDDAILKDPGGRQIFKYGRGFYYGMSKRYFFIHFYS